MEYCPGGDMYSILQYSGYFNEKAASQYLAEIVLALEFLHKQGIIHRDLKPDNLLIDAEGHVKLIDYGLSKIGIFERRDFKNNQRYQNQKIIENENNITNINVMNKDISNDSKNNNSNNLNTFTDIGVQISLEDSLSISEEEKSEVEDSQQFEVFDSLNNLVINSIDLSNTMSDSFDVSLNNIINSNTIINLNRNKQLYGNKNSNENSNENGNGNGNENSCSYSDSNSNSNKYGKKNNYDKKKECQNENVKTQKEIKLLLSVNKLQTINKINGQNKNRINYPRNAKSTETKLRNVHFYNSGKNVTSSQNLAKKRFGISDEHNNYKHGAKKKHHIVGTPDYLSPEILLGQGHSFGADWWSFGVIVYQMTVGFTPFGGRSLQEIWSNILSLNIEFPEFLSDELVDLISKLLVNDPKKRLGKNGAQEVKNHPFFKNIVWENLKTQDPPLIPKLSDPTDLKYHKKARHYTEQEIEPEILDDMHNATFDETLLYNQEQNLFNEFSSINWDELLKMNLYIAESHSSTVVSSRTLTPTSEYEQTSPSSDTNSENEIENNNSVGTPLQTPRPMSPIITQFIKK